jgi:hypothetical protein
MPQSQTPPVRSMEHKAPGLPPALKTEGIPGILSRLWTLSYIRNNNIKTTVLLMPLDVNVDKAVELAKGYCKTRSVNFSWLEKTIVDLTEDSL